jgi:hypothetical protein
MGVPKRGVDKIHGNRHRPSGGLPSGEGGIDSNLEWVPKRGWTRCMETDIDPMVCPLEKEG